MKYYITTFGCQMNEHESEKLAGMLENMGYSLSNTLKEADVILFNTCAIRDGAEHKVLGNIGRLKQLKKDFPDKIIAVCGCMMQQKEVADRLYQKFPFVDIIFGTHNINDFQQYLADYKSTQKRILKIEEQRPNCEYTNIVRSSGENAWINIMYGCNNFCTYCIVPYVRGREQSREKNEIISEIKNVVSLGKYKLITLLGQNVNSYGNDNKEHFGNFASLLKDVCKIEGDFKVTFMTSNPKDLTDEVIDVIASEPKILKEIHLPVQSGSNRILALMNRKYTRESYLTLVSKIKEKIPLCHITTDFIVGFPTESEEDFNESVSLVKLVKFNVAFVFMYSKRPGTPAEKMEGQISDEIKHERVNKLLDIAKEVQHEQTGDKK